MVKDCRSCCAKEVKATVVKYDKALLEVCKGRLYHFPEVKDFLTKHSKKAVSKNLKVSHPMWAMPMIYGLDAKGKTIESVG